MGNMSKEYIDRDAVLRAILGQPPDAHYPGWYADSIKEIPAADVAPVVHGYWVEIKGMAPPEYHGKHKCSVCGEKALCKKMHEVLSDYCPHCGAKMDGGKE